MKKPTPRLKPVSAARAKTKNEFIINKYRSGMGLKDQESVHIAR